ncbi:MAG: sulfatase-like hydrolase/transferase [Planctomycetota bacterium]
MSDTSPSNVLLIYTDQWRYDALGCAGNDEIITPNLDRLAVRGVRFSRCFVQHPLCMPSRYSMLSGRYPSSLGVTHMGVPVPADAETLQRILSRFGYRTANLGKLHFLPHANRDHRQPHPSYGFDHAQISDEPGVYPDAYQAWVQRYFSDQLPLITQVADPPAAQVWRDTMGISDETNRPGEGFDPYRTRAFPGRAEATHSAFVADRTLHYLSARTNDKTPFLCVSSFYNPHSPLVAPQKYLDLYKDRSLAPPAFPEELQDQRIAQGLTDDYLVQAKLGYYAMISEVDDHVGRILQKLDETGLAERTVVLFTSDHGEFLGEHLSWGKGYPAPDCVLRVPLIVAGASVESSGRVCDEIVEAVDIVPTVLSCLGLPIPPTIEGRSLRNALMGSPSSEGLGEALAEDTDWKLLRTAEHRYLRHRDGREELYDLHEPFGEYRDIAADVDQRNVLATMRQRLLAKLHSKERPLERRWPY